VSTLAARRRRARDRGFAPDRGPVVAHSYEHGIPAPGALTPRHGSATTVASVDSQQLHLREMVGQRVDVSGECDK
jgi:hypothetical protein